MARFIVRQLPDGQYLLTLDRTNWKFGQTNINILCLAIAQQGVVIPALSILLDKKGNSNTDERIPLIHKFIELFGVEKIDGYIVAGASPFFAKPEMGSVRFRVQKIRRRPWPSAAHIRPASIPARTPLVAYAPSLSCAPP